MTENRNDEARDDGEFRELFDPIRGMTAPVGLDRKCLEVAREATARAAATDRSSEEMSARFPYWLVAIAASLLIGLSIGWTLRGQAEKGTVSSTTGMLPVQVSSRFPNHRPVGEPFDATSTVDYHQDGVNKPHFITREIYLCGVGRVQSKSEFQFLGEKQ